jgi:hypothetical protein
MMNWTKILIAALIGGVVYFFCGWGIHGIVLREATALAPDIRAVVEIPETEFKMSYMVISCLLMGLLMALILHWAAARSFISGLKVAAPLGVLITFAGQLALSSMYRFLDFQQIAIAAVGEGLCWAIAGGVVAWYLGRGE